MKSVPTPPTSRPSTGQRAISDFAMKRTGPTACNAKISSHDTWFATTSTFGCASAPVIRMSMLIKCSSRLDQLRIRARRAWASSDGKTNQIVARPRSK